MSKNALRIDDLTARVASLEADNRRLSDAIQTLMRHYQTLGRNLRRVLADNKALRVERASVWPPTDPLEPSR